MAPQLSALEHMAASGTGAATAALFTNPLEVAKTRLQMQNELVRAGAPRAYRGVFDCLGKTWAREGLAGIQRGLPIACLRDGSKCFFRLGLYEPLLSQLHDPAHGKQAPPHIQLLCGGLSGSVAALVCNPLDIVKVRVQTAGGLGASHHDVSNLRLHQVFRKIVSEEGVLGLWSGTPVNMFRSITFTAVLLAVNDRVKHALTATGLGDGFARDASASFVGSLIGTIVMNPVDVVRTRVYNQPKGNALYDGAVDAARKIARAEGVWAFYKGFGAHYLRVGPHTVLSFVIIGELKRMLLAAKRDPAN